MLQKCYGYHRSGDTSTGEVYRQTRYIGRRGTSGAEVSRQVRYLARRGCEQAYTHIYARGELGKLEAASWKLQAGRAGNTRTQKQAGGAKTVGMIGCGLMFTGLLLGALSGSIVLCLVVVGIGMVLTGCASILEQYKE